MSTSGKAPNLLEASLRGTTLRVYWQILRSEKPISVRELQRTLGFASPSTALHHLEKLREMKIIKKDDYGQYILVGNVKVGVLRMFLRLGRLMLPRYLFYATFFLVALTLYVAQTLIIGDMPNVMVVLFGASATVMSMYETLRLWREKLF